MFLIVRSRLTIGAAKLQVQWQATLKQQQGLGGNRETKTFCLDFILEHLFK